MSSLFSKTSALRKDLKILDVNSFSCGIHLFQSGIYVAIPKYLMRTLAHDSGAQFKTFANTIYLQYDRRRRSSTAFSRSSHKKPATTATRPVKIFQDHILPRSGSASRQTRTGLDLVAGAHRRGTLTWPSSSWKPSAPNCLLGHPHHRQTFGGRACGGQAGLLYGYSLRTTPREIVALYFTSTAPGCDPAEFSSCDLRQIN
jgi:hypothetical protein